MPELKELAFKDVLERHLGQVSAPEELWTRVRNGSSAAKRSRPVARRLILSAVLALAVGGSAWILHPRGDAQLRSANPTAVREWVRVNASLEVPLRDSSPTRLLGAHMTNYAAEIAYQGGTLTVAKSAPGVDNHLAAVSEAKAGAKLISWTMRGQAFSVACDDPDQAHAACLLCHS